jgi:hypothetical protein
MENNLEPISITEKSLLTESNKDYAKRRFNVTCVQSLCGKGIMLLFPSTQRHNHIKAITNGLLNFLAHIPNIDIYYRHDEKDKTKIYNIQIMPKNTKCEFWKED